MPPSWRFHLASKLPGISSHIEGVNCAESPDNDALTKYYDDFVVEIFRFKKYLGEGSLAEGRVLHSVSSNTNISAESM